MSGAPTEKAMAAARVWLNDESGYDICDDPTCGSCGTDMKAVSLAAALDAFAAEAQAETIRNLTARAEAAERKCETLTLVYDIGKDEARAQLAAVTAERDRERAAHDALDASHLELNVQLSAVTAERNATADAYLAALTSTASERDEARAALATAVELLEDALDAPMVPGDGTPRAIKAFVDAIKGNKGGAM